MRPRILITTKRMAGGLAGFMRQLRGESGNNLIEYAMVLIIFLSILFGIVGFGQALYAYHFVSTAAKTAARWAAVNGSTCGPGKVAGTAMDGSCNGTSGMNNGPASATDIANYVLTTVPPGIDPDPSRLTTTASWPIQPNGPAACAATKNAPGCTVEVQVSYSFKFPVAFISTATLPLSSTAEMVVVH